MSKQKALNFKVQSFFDPLPPIAITFITAISKILAKFSFGISVFFKLLKNYILLNIKSKVARNTDLVPSEITLSTNPSTWTNGNVTVRDAGAVEKSYPDFFKDYAELGGQANVIIVE